MNHVVELEVVSLVFDESFEETGEDECVVDLVGVVASSCGDYLGSCLFGFVWVDFGGGVGKCEYDGVALHCLDVFLREDVCYAYADERGCSVYGFFECRCVWIGLFGDACFVFVEICACGCEDSFAVEDGYVCVSCFVEEVCGCDPCGSCAVYDDGAVFVVGGDFVCVDEGCEDDHCCAVLVVVEDGYG